MFKSEYDRELETYYFRADEDFHVSAHQIILPNRTVILDVDHSGQIIGIEVI